jgi:hypothetical protein
VIGHRPDRPLPFEDQSSSQCWSGAATGTHLPSASSREHRVPTSHPLKNAIWLSLMIRCHPISPSQIPKCWIGRSEPLDITSANDSGGPPVTRAVACRLTESGDPGSQSASKSPASDRLRVRFASGAFLVRDQGAAWTNARRLVPGRSPESDRCIVI